MVSSPKKSDKPSPAKAATPTAKTSPTKKSEKTSPKKAVADDEEKPRVSGQGLLERQKSSAHTGTLVRGASFMSEDPDNDEAFIAAQKKKLAAVKKSMTGTQGSKLADQLKAPELAAFTRTPTMLHDPKRLIPSPVPEKKYTIVLDLDETVVYARDGPLYARAHLKDMLRTMNEVGEVIVWTAGDREYAKAVLKEINIEEIIQHLVYRDKTWFNKEDYTKDLRQLGRDMDYVMIIENTPDCLRLNPLNGIIVDDYEGGSSKDSTLLNLIRLVKDLGESNKTVPDFLTGCKLLQKQTVNTGDQDINILFLPSRKIPERKAKTPAEESDPSSPTSTKTPLSPTQNKVVKQNRDRVYAAGAKLPPGADTQKTPSSPSVGSKRTERDEPAEAPESPSKKKRRLEEEKKK